MSNLIQRSITGALFIIVMVGCIVASPLTFILLFAAITGLAVWEFSTIVNRQAGADVNRLINTTSCVYLFLVFAYTCSPLCGGHPLIAFTPLLITVLFLLISELYLQHNDPLKSWAYAFASHLYVALPFALLNLLAFTYNPMTNQWDHTWQYPLALFIFLWANDTGAYCVGSLLSKRFPAKLFERISPKKSWWGVIGGCITGVLVSWGLSALGWLHLDVAHAMCFGAVLSVVGVLGDLVESMWKRYFSVKDSGHLIPGHGGLYDRLDSTIFAIVCAVVYLEVFGLLL